MWIRKNIPNALTLLNLLCGCILVVLAARNFGQVWTDHIRIDVILMLVLLIVALVADLLDGMVARKLGVQSPLGVQLDSLADMVSFGLFPGMLMAGMIAQMPVYQNYVLISAVGFLITLASAMRLAKFNISGSEVPYFLGLATPANTLWVFGYYMWLEQQQWLHADVKLLLTVIFVLISSYLLVSHLPLFNLKDGKFHWKRHLHVVLLLIGVVVLFGLFHITSLFYIIPLYILLSLIFRHKFVP